MSDKQKAIAKSYLRAFLAAILTAFLADGADLWAVDVTDLRAWLAAGVAAVVGPAIAAMDPTDPRFGRGSAATPKHDMSDFYDVL